MRPATHEWIEKAEADFAAAMILRRSRKRHSRDIVCFHMQQCIEKYLKARLVKATVQFPKTHDLERLLDLCIEFEPLWESIRPAVIEITDFAVEVRYPGRSVTVAQANRVVRLSQRTRIVLRTSLGLG